MKLTKSDLGEIVKNFSEFIDKEEVKSEGDLRKRLGERFEVSDEDSILVELRPSKQKTIVYTMGYVRLSTGIAIEVRLNSKLRYSEITLKVKDFLPGYMPFAEDPYGNICQSRSLDFGLNHVKSELERIRKICS